MTLLPSNASMIERATEAATAPPVAVPLADLWNPVTCPAALLPWLAWALSVDDWDADWPEQVKRDVIAASVEIHRRKGPVWAMRRALDAAGLGEATIQEGWSGNVYDGFDRNGSRYRQQTDHWAEYRVTLARPVSIAQSARARSILTAAAPMRCHLKVMSFEQAAFLYDATVPRGGTHSRGTI